MVAMSARTWEEATCDVAVALPSWREGAELTLDEVLVDIGEVLDDMRGLIGGEDVAFRYLAWLGAVGYVKEKWPLNENADAFVRACDAAVVDVLVLLPKKQHDYGPDNILWGGVQGVVVRAHDKLARIKNLKKRGARWAHEDKPRIESMNEPLSDSYFDLIGYGIVGAMLVKGTFQLPLEADLHKQEITHYGSGKQGEWFVVRPSDPWLTDEQIGSVRAIVRDELAKREIAKLHG